MVVVDTNVVIDHLRSKGVEQTLFEEIVSKAELPNVAVSVITLQELFAGQSTKNVRKKAELTTMIQSLLILPYSEDIARRAGELARDLTQPIEFADAAIAATALIFDAPLATLNTKHFKSIPQLQLFSL